MAATQYQVMYRCMNEAMNMPITNDPSSKYDPVFEFYVEPDHRIYLNDPIIQGEEMQKQQEMISSANQASNVKHDMLFVYDGCKKIPHQQWVPDQVGYVVRNWKAIRSKIGDRGDYTKDFTCLNAETPEDGAVVVCTQTVLKNYKNNGYFSPEPHVFCVAGDYSSDEVQQLLDDSTIFALTMPSWKDHAELNGSSSKIWSVPYSGYWHSHYNGDVVAQDYKGPIRVDESRDMSTVSGYYQGSTEYKDHKIHANASNIYSEMSYSTEDLLTTTIPGHYEDVADAPYAIKDQYRRIDSSPWSVHCTVGSLEAALTKAKKLVEMIGLENVKVIKLVAIDQFIKIR